MRKNMQLKKADIDVVDLNSEDNLLAKEENCISYWENAMKTNEIIEVEFPFRDKSGNLYAYYGNVCVKLLMYEIFGTNDMKSADLEIRSKYSVIVIGIKEGVVYTSYIQAMDGPRTELIKLIDDTLEKGKYIRTQARILGFAGKSDHAVTKGMPTICLIDITGRGLMGFIRLEEWSIDFTNKFRFVAEKGQVIDIVVLKKQLWNSGMIYECSRRLALAEDPLDTIEERIPKGTTVKVRCVEVKNSTEFIGKVVGIDDVSVHCSIIGMDGFTPILGEYYSGVVHKINRKKVSEKRSGSIYVDIKSKID